MAMPMLRQPLPALLPQLTFVINLAAVAITKMQLLIQQLASHNCQKEAYSLDAFGQVIVITITWQHLSQAATTPNRPLNLVDMTSLL